MSTIYITITVDWEGEHVLNLNDLVQFRKKIGTHIPITHFICPTYFIDGNKRDIVKIKDTIEPHDEVALHIHPLKKLLKHVGIPFRKEYNFYRSPIKKLNEYLMINGKTRNPFSRWSITGRGVPLSVYPDEEINKIIHTSKSILEQEFPEKPINGFRAGGWITNDTIFKTLKELQFRYDSSAVPPSFFSTGYNNSSDGNLKDCYNDKNGVFTEYMMTLWGRNKTEIPFLSNSLYKQLFKEKFIDEYTQPFFVNGLLELPNNGGMSDFVCKNNFEQIFEIAQDYIANFQHDFFLNLGFHQEGEYENKVAAHQFLYNTIIEETDEVEFITCNETFRKILKNK